mmetsp:Transcript_18555/g.53659  ORF Transcript_18555/g.53659 Transcript_18555/m.53659 type:complete len:461 (+) Transcript_18555:190-1572(+)
MTFASAEDEGFSRRLENVTRLFAQQNLHDLPSQVLQEVTPEDRESSLYDVHGVLQPAAETDNIVEQRIFELKRCLAGSVMGAEAFHAALRKNATFVEDQLLKFLRADRLDVEKAASRAKSHFQKRLELFGPRALSRDLEWNDLDEVSRDILLKGGFQMNMQLKDRNGRIVITHYPHICEYYSVINVVRALFWLSAIASGDPETQKRGVVYIFYGVGSRMIHRDGNDRPVEFLRTVPALLVKIAAYHVCLEDVSLKEFVSTGAYHLDSQTMIRVASHFGNSLECKNNLMTMGIPPEVIQVNDDGSIRTEAHLKWLEPYRKGLKPDISTQSSGTSTCSEMIKEPGPRDVVCGKGQRGNKSQGNAFLRSLLEENFEEYNRSSKANKTLLSEAIYSTMIQAGCRFVAPVYDWEKGPFKKGRPIPKGWIDVEASSALERIAHGFRNLRQSMKKGDFIPQSWVRES